MDDVLVWFYLSAWLNLSCRWYIVQNKSFKKWSNLHLPFPDRIPKATGNGLCRARIQPYFYSHWDTAVTVIVFNQSLLSGFALTMLRGRQPSSELPTSLGSIVFMAGTCCFARLARHPSEEPWLPHSSGEQQPWAGVLLWAAAGVWPQLLAK